MPFVAVLVHPWDDSCGESILAFQGNTSKAVDCFTSLPVCWYSSVDRGLESTGGSQILAQCLACNFDSIMRHNPGYCGCGPATRYWQGRPSPVQCPQVVDLVADGVCWLGWRHGACLNTTPNMANSTDLEHQLSSPQLLPYIDCASI
jgi:hypothetical protein